MSNAATAPSDEAIERERERKADVHEQGVEEREAYEYWGYLFKPDKTGTDKLKSLLRGLKDAINEKYERSDQPDLTPSQLASFYRDLHGNYDQLFLGTPNESIAFIYKSLGCLHSLQPPAYTHATAFTDPTVPALKTEGWIMWQTIQLLLGPEEHASFLREAVQLFDVKDHDTGEVFPKILPRECFPLEPDKHMVAWYEGVSERLRREAEDEERHKQVEVEHEPEVRRLHSRENPPRQAEVMSEEEGSVDSRGPALAYFRNPLYRHVDGRPSIVRKNSKRPALSPRQSVMDKGKEAVSQFSRIARNVGSPHLWDGGRGSSRSRDRFPEGRRKSHPESHHHHPHADEPIAAAGGAHDIRHAARERSGHSSQRRRRSSQIDEPPDRTSPGTSADDEWDQSEASPVYSPPQPHGKGSDSSRHRHSDSSSKRRHGHSQSHSHSRPVSRDDREQPLRHSKSHEPTPSQEFGEGDYFAGHDEPAPRRNSSHEKYTSPPPEPQQPPGPALGPSFGPSAGPLFAAQVAKQPHPPAQRYQPPQSGNGYDGGPSMRNPSVRRAQDQGRYSSRSPAPGSRPPPPRDPRDARDPRDRKYDSPGRPPPAPYDDMPPNGRGYGSPDPRERERSRYSDSPPGRGSRDRDPRDPRDRDPRDARDPRDRRERRSGSELDQYPDDRRGSRQGPPPPGGKHARFADTGVGGRRYPDDAPWR